MTQRLGRVVPAAIRAHLAIAKGRARHAAVEWAILLRLRAAGGGDGAAWTINAVAHVAIKAADLSSVITVCRALADAVAHTGWQSSGQESHDSMSGSHTESPHGGAATLVAAFCMAAAVKAAAAAMKRRRRRPRWR